MRLRVALILLVCLLAVAPGCRFIAAAGVIAADIALSSLDDDDSLFRSRDQADHRVCSPHRPRQITRRDGASGRRP
jgi:hypothetical protein